MSRWLFFPSPAASGPLQVSTWTMSGPSTASSVVETGLPIISLRLGGLNSSAGKPRFFNGAEAASAAGFDYSTGSGSNTLYYFTSGTTCRAWWDNYAVSVTINGGASISLGDPVGGVAQPAYVNTAPSPVLSPMDSGDVLVFTVTAAS